jgi:hypothetical protein
VLDQDATDERPWPTDQSHYGLSGTSQAAALVSGVAALLLQHTSGKKLHPTTITDAIKRTARPMGFGKYEEGNGLVDLDRAIAAL